MPRTLAKLYQENYDLMFSALSPEMQKRVKSVSKMDSEDREVKDFISKVAEVAERKWEMIKNSTPEKVNISKATPDLQ